MAATVFYSLFTASNLDGRAHSHSPGLSDIKTAMMRGSKTAPFPRWTSLARALTEPTHPRLLGSVTAELALF